MTTEKTGKFNENKELRNCSEPSADERNLYQQYLNNAALGLSPQRQEAWLRPYGEVSYNNAYLPSA